MHRRSKGKPNRKAQKVSENKGRAELRDPNEILRRQNASLRQQAEAAGKRVSELEQANESLRKSSREQDEEARQRVLKLAEANNALKQTLDILADEKQLDHALGHVLKVTSDYLGSPCSALCLWDKSQERSRVHLLYLRGEIIEAKPENLSRRENEWPLEGDLYWNSHLSTRCPVIYDVDTCSHFSPAQRSSLNEMGIKTLLGVPLVLCSQAFGSFTVCFRERRLFTDVELDLLQAFAHQATLACQLTRFAGSRQQAAVLEERGRIAREIHDSLAQAFAGISMQLEAALLSRRGARGRYWKNVGMAKELACFGLAEARSSVLTLRQNALDHGDLSATLRQLSQRTQIEGELRCEFIERGRARELPLELRHESFRIVQEALGNALKHAQPKSIRITLAYHTENIVITVHDDGTGFNQKDYARTRGFGLVGMEERAKKLGGTYSMKSSKGHGTTVRVNLPILRHHE